MKARFIFEKFTEDSDPITDMGIGYGEFLNIKEGDILILKKGFESLPYSEEIGHPPYEAIVANKPEFNKGHIKLKLIPFKKVKESEINQFKHDKLKGFLSDTFNFNIKVWNEYFTVKKM